MKKYLTFLFCLSFFVVAVAQKNSFEIGMPAYDHLEGAGMTSSRFSAATKTKWKILYTSYLGYDRHFTDTKSLHISFITFSRTYQFLPYLPVRNIGVTDRRFGNLNVSYRQRLLALGNNRISLSGAVGVDYRMGKTYYFWGYAQGGRNHSLVSQDGMVDIGASIGANIGLKISKKLFLNMQSNYVYYLAGLEGLSKFSNGLQRNRQVVWATLSLGYRF